VTVYLWTILVISWVMVIEHASIAIWAAVSNARNDNPETPEPILRAAFSALWFAIMCGSFYFIVTNG
jgi:hypothetical protein